MAQQQPQAQGLHEEALICRTLSFTMRNNPWRTLRLKCRPESLRMVLSGRAVVKVEGAPAALETESFLLFVPRIAASLHAKADEQGYVGADIVEPLPRKQGLLDLAC